MGSENQEFRLNDDTVEAVVADHEELNEHERDNKRYCGSTQSHN